MIDMTEAQVRTVEQVRQVLEGTQALEFRRTEDDEGRYRWIGAVLRLRRQAVRCAQDAVAGADVGLAPGRRRGGGLVEVGDQCVELGVVQAVAEGGHLAGRTAVADSATRLGRLQPLQAFRQQGRTDCAEAVGSMAARALLCVERGHIAGGARLGDAHSEQQGCELQEREFDERSVSLLTRRTYGRRPLPPGERRSGGGSHITSPSMGEVGREASG